ncbi:splicing factor u2af-associated protein 2, partial [Moniliophthora roreri]
PDSFEKYTLGSEASAAGSSAVEAEDCGSEEDMFMNVCRSGDLNSEGIFLTGVAHEHCMDVHQASSYKVTQLC